MLTLQTDSVGWVDGAEGLRLTLRSPRARSIAAAVKQGKVYTVEIKEYRKKRSLDQNALYWRCLGELSRALRESTPYLHNIMLRRYGQMERYDDQPVIVMLPDTEEAANKADEAETYHVKPTSQTKPGKGGTSWRAYVLLRGSSTYDTAEMKQLIDGLLDECRQAGVDVLTEQERTLIYGEERIR